MKIDYSWAEYKEPDYGYKSPYVLKAFAFHLRERVCDVGLEPVCLVGTGTSGISLAAGCRLQFPEVFKNYLDPKKSSSSEIEDIQEANVIFVDDHVHTGSTLKNIKTHLLAKVPTFFDSYLLHICTITSKLNESKIRNFFPENEMGNVWIINQ